MFDETNKTEEQELVLPEKLFESEEPEINENTDGENQIADSEEVSETLRIKYNGEERDISLDEARVLAQKGMNYDHVVAERDTKYQRELDVLDKVAAEQGMTRAQYIASVEGRTPPQNMEDNGNLRAAAAVRAQEQIKRIQENAGFSGAWGNLFRRYPKLSRESAYAELSEAVRGGLTPLEAYQSQLLAEKERALRITQNNGAAALRSVGSLEGEGSGQMRDDFLEGFSIDE